MNYYYSDGELYHARQYSHKYIKKIWKNGRWQYWYKTDMNAGKHTHANAYTTGFGRIGFAKKESDSSFDDKNTFALFKPKGNQTYTFKTADDFRKADKAATIYKEGLVDSFIKKKSNTKFKKNSVDNGKNFVKKKGSIKINKKSIDNDKNRVTNRPLSRKKYISGNGKAIYKR